MTQQQIWAKGWNGQLWFDGFFVTISRKGFVGRTRVGKGDKRIPVSSIQAVQWKDAGFSFGYIQFTLAGGVERRSAFGWQSHDANSDENSVTFFKQHQPAFEPIRYAIEHALAMGQQAGMYRPPPVAPPPPQGPPPGWYPDPQGNPAFRRWWDGYRYTEHTQLQQQFAPPHRPPPSAGGPG